MFLFIFISFDRSSNFQHHIQRNIERELFLFKFFVILSVVRFHQRYLLICSTQNTYFCFLFSDKLSKFIFTILWVTYDMILLFLLFSIVYIIPFSSHSHWHCAHLFHPSIFRTVDTQSSRQVSMFLQAIMFMYELDVIPYTDIVEWLSHYSLLKCWPLFDFSYRCSWDPLRFLSARTFICAINTSTIQSMSLIREDVLYLLLAVYIEQLLKYYSFSYLMCEFS